MSKASDQLTIRALESMVQSLSEALEAVNEDLFSYGAPLGGSRYWQIRRRCCGALQHIPTSLGGRRKEPTGKPLEEEVIRPPEHYSFRCRAVKVTEASAEELDILKIAEKHYNAQHNTVKGIMGAEKLVVFAQEILKEKVKPDRPTPADPEPVAELVPLEEYGKDIRWLMNLNTLPAGTKLYLQVSPSLAGLEQWRTSFYRTIQEYCVLARDFEHRTGAGDIHPKHQEVIARANEALAKLDHQLRAQKISRESTLTGGSE